MTPEIAWLTGFYEGEGSFGCYANYVTKSGETRYTARWVIVQKDKESLHMVKDILLDEGIQASINYHHTGVWVVGITRVDEILKVFGMMWPMLTERRKRQAIDQLSKRNQVPGWMYDEETGTA